MTAVPNVIPHRPRPYRGAQLLAPNLFSKGVNSAEMEMSCTKLFNDIDGSISIDDSAVELPTLNHENP